MELDRFKVRVPGKWVLTGEHAVLRGAAAVALPHPQLGLTLSFEPGRDLGQSPRALAVDPPEAQDLIGDLFSTAQKALEQQGKALPKPAGKLQIDSSIPIGAGLGSSAALCVALTQWVSKLVTLQEDQTVEFATHLEHHFHGRSSGMDVAVIAAGEPISYSMQAGMHPIGVHRLPKFTFHDTGLRSRTSDCVRKVEQFRVDTPSLGVLYDEKMSKASQDAVEGLRQFNLGHDEKGLALIQSAMMQARECFYSWELVPGEARRLEESLLKQGALAVKLTGAGGGGIVVALWPQSS